MRSRVRRRARSRTLNEVTAVKAKRALRGVPFFVWLRFPSFPFVCLCRRSAAEQRVRKLLGAEGLQILDLLADADEVNRNRPLPRDCRENAALRRAVELGDDET